MSGVKPSYNSGNKTRRESPVKKKVQSSFSWVQHSIECSQTNLVVDVLAQFNACVARKCLFWAEVYLSRSNVPKKSNTFNDLLALFKPHSRRNKQVHRLQIRKKFCYVTGLEDYIVQWLPGHALVVA